tara:strand:+ start:386 stop:1393 length:1008 start_codon:yes stop_codon:yes gene_type:complete
VIKNNSINNKTVLVTGATGSFGSNFIENVLKNNKPKKIIIYSRDEFKQYSLEQNFSNPKLKFIIGDVRDLERLKIACRGVDTLIHAAALKHVPIAEKNPIEYIKTNIQGAENVIKASIYNNINKVLALSTDKAANPINLYGTTKLASDKLFISANKEYPKIKTIFSVVRYGNVINSRGSVLPLFKELKRKKFKTLPITHKEMTRFWISLEEGVEFVKDCLEMMRGEEIFVPKIKSIKTVDLARLIIPKSKFKMIGIRPGEKIHETLCPKETSQLTLEFKKYYSIYPNEQSLKEKQYNTLREKGVKVPENFEYSSDNSNSLMKKSEINKFLKNYLV